MGKGPDQPSIQELEGLAEEYDTLMETKEEENEKTPSFDELIRKVSRIPGSARCVEVLVELDRILGQMPEEQRLQNCPGFLVRLRPKGMDINSLYEAMHALNVRHKVLKPPVSKFPFELDMDWARFEKDPRDCHTGLLFARINHGSALAIFEIPRDIVTRLSVLDAVMAKYATLRGKFTYCIVIQDPLDPEELQQIRSVLDKHLYTITLDIQPTDEELVGAILDGARESGASLTSESELRNQLIESLAREKEGKDFNFSTFAERATMVLLYGDLARSHAPMEAAPLPEDHIQKREEIAKTRLQGSLRKLDRLAGLADLKQKVREILMFHQWRQMAGVEDEDVGNPSLHMVFLGNPGTGKTLAARLIGEIFREAGILTQGDFHEVTRTDLVSQYIGQTEQKTLEVCNKAIGSVLFIDEAYALYSEEKGRDFGEQVINTLLPFMEEHRRDTVVILAGYTNEMLRLLSMNPGLRSRIAHTIAFADYMAEELTEIFLQQMGEALTLANPARSRLERHFERIASLTRTDSRIGNGRYARNLYERSILKMAERVVRDGIQDAERQRMLVEADIEAASQELLKGVLDPNLRIIRPIGFQGLSQESTERDNRIA